MLTIKRAKKPFANSPLPCAPYYGFFEYNMHQLAQIIEETPRSPELEQDVGHMQLVTYVLVVTETGHIAHYSRGTGDSRLVAKRSIGFGGHVENYSDLPEKTAEHFEDHLYSEARRELIEELNIPLWGGPEWLRRVGWIGDGTDAVGRVHLGALFVAKVKAEELEMAQRNSEIEDLQLGTYHDLQDMQATQLEGWSQIVVNVMKLVYPPVVGSDE